jgi:nucleoside-diphosphate-sugar epimerase
VYNVADEEALTYREWVRLMASLMGWRGELVAAPNEVLPPHLRDGERIDYRQHLVATTARIRRELGYAEVIGRDDGLRRTLDAYAAEPEADPAAASREYPAEDAALVTLRGSAVLKG